ncbi:MAG: hypothetical protein EBT92_11890 [Planctomycetes bacterium]|nr:hypothetical protein [Planctomycetota bacterium]NBY01413.1 hypothetical protein [Planctomycetota bacterium]
MPVETKTVLVLCDDLIFSSKISGEARAIGLQAKVVKTVDKLVEVSSCEKFAGALIDLGIASPELEKLITELRASQGVNFPCLGYGSHVDVELLRKARSLGYDPVLPRSKFVLELMTILLSYSNNNC